MDRIDFWTIAVAIGLISFFVIVLCCEDCSFDFCYSPTVMAYRFLIVALLFIGSTFVYTQKWLTTDSILFKVKRQPITLAAYCHSDIPAQVYGRIDSGGKTIVSPYTRKECVFYHYIKEKRVETDNRSYWKVIENIFSHVPFSVIDESGEIGVNLRNVDSVIGGYKVKKDHNPALVDYAHSEVDAKKAIYHKLIDEGGLFRAKQRVSEFILTDGQKVFVNGWVYEKFGKKFLAESKETPLILSRKTKEKYLEDFAKGDNFFYNSNFLLLIGSTIVFLLLYFYMQINPIILSLIFFVVFARIIYSIYNRAITLRTRCANAESQIMIELRKRNRLLPQLETVVKAYAEHEKNTLETITLARVSLHEQLSEKDLQNYLEKEKQLASVLAVVEKYPDLKADKLFKDFMMRISVIEENIAYFRGFYNKTVLKYNTLIQQFPFVLITKPLGFKEKEYYKFEQ